MKFVQVATAAVCMALFIGACDRNKEKTQAKPQSVAAPTAKKGTIGVTVMTLKNPFFKLIGDTITAEANKKGYDVIVLSGDEAANQQNQVKDFIVQKCAAIVICPRDSQAIGAAIREANQAGIPVFTADLATLDTGAKVVSHVATNNYQGGVLAGDAMAEALGEGGGKVVVLDFKDAESCLERVRGFKDSLAKHNQGAGQNKIEIVAELPSGGDTLKGNKSAEDALQAHPDIAGIFAINDPSALGARAAVEKAGKADRVKIVGFDGMPEGKKAIKEGKIYADPVQFPERIASMTVDNIVKYFNGETVAPKQEIDTALYRQADGLKDPTLK